MGFVDLESMQPIETVPGCRLRAPFGQHLMLSYLEMEADAEIPMHHHLAALIGVSEGVCELEGVDPSMPNGSSAVAAIVSFYGASNLQTILNQSTPYGLTVRVPALRMLLGGLPEDDAAKARLASPVAHVSATDPPLFLIHGDQDPQMPIEQAYELQRAYRQAKLSVQMHVVLGGAHGGKGFYEPEVLSKVAEFLTSVSQPDP